MRVLGMISGTSHDGIDVAVVDFALSGDGNCTDRSGTPPVRRIRPTCGPA